MYFRNIIILLLLLLPGIILAQEPLDHEKSIYRSPEGKLYINREAPIYLRISGSPREDTASYLLKSQKTPEYANPMYLDMEGYNTVRSPWKVDPETKKYVYPKEDIVFEIYADSKPPETRLDLNIKDVIVDGNRIMAGQEFRLQFESLDEMSGVEDVYYSINREPYQKITDPIHMDEEKKLTLRYYGVDHVGNAEEPKENEIIIDLSGPRTNHEITGDQHKNIISGRSELHLEATDQMTRVKQTYYSIDGGDERTYQQPIDAANLSKGEHMLTFYSMDEVKNKEDEKIFRFYVDKTPPRVVEELMGNTYIANGKEYFSGKNRLKLLSMDNKAGVKEIRYSINDGPFKKYTKPFSLNKPGNLDIEIQAIDSVNNKIQEKKLTDRSNVSYVDLSGPTLDYRFTGPVLSMRDTTYINSKTNIRLTGEDDESGFNRIEYRVEDNESMKKYEAPFSIKKEGIYSVQYTGYDNLDNMSVDEFVCKVDNEGPKIFHRFSMPPVSQKTLDGVQYPVFPEHVVLFLSATDTRVGFDNMYFSVNGSKEKSYRSLLKEFTEGAYDIKVTAEDKLGNQKEDTIHFYIE